MLETARESAEKDLESLREEMETLRRQLAKARQPLEAVDEVEEVVEALEEEIAEPVVRKTPSNRCATQRTVAPRREGAPALD